MIQIEWHLLLLIILLIAGISYVYILEDTNSGILPSSREVGCFMYFIFAFIAIIVYGGIYWW